MKKAGDARNVSRPDRTWYLIILHPRHRGTMATATKSKRVPVIDDDRLAQAKPVIRAICLQWRYIRGRELEDLENECLIQVCRQFSKFDPKFYVWEVWVSVVSQRACQNAWVKSKREPRLTSEAGESELNLIESRATVPDAVCADIIRSEIVDCVRSALAKLPTDERNALAEVYGLEGSEATNSFAEVGRRLGFMSGKALRLHDEALSKLRGLLKGVSL